jgi:hypothetical protein
MERERTHMPEGTHHIEAGRKGGRAKRGSVRESALYQGDTVDALLGVRGALGDGARPLTYAWCARERLYHYTSARRGAPNTVHPGEWTERVAQPKRDVRTVRPTVAQTMAHTSPALAFIERYEAQRVSRSRPPMLRGAGSVALRDQRAVALTLGARHALARVNEWATAEGSAQRAEDWARLCERVNAREA